MVQDMFGPEYYYDVFETEVSTSGEKKLHSGRYRDVTPTTVSKIASCFSGLVYGQSVDIQLETNQHISSMISPRSYKC